MTPSKYHNELFILPCPNCNSTDVEESGDDIDGQVNCNYCTLATPYFHGTRNAIHAWNNRSYNDDWGFWELDAAQAYYQI